jgi:hypothetical protein
MANAHSLGKFQFLGGTGHNPNSTNFNVNDVYEVLSFTSSGAGEIDMVTLNKNGDLVVGIFINDTAEWQLVAV